MLPWVASEATPRRQRIYYAGRGGLVAAQSLPRAALERDGVTVQVTAIRPADRRGARAPCVAVDLDIACERPVEFRADAAVSWCWLARRP